MFLQVKFVTVSPKLEIDTVPATFVDSSTIGALSLYKSAKPPDLHHNALAPADSCFFLLG